MDSVVQDGTVRVGLLVPSQPKEWDKVVYALLEITVLLEAQLRFLVIQDTSVVVMVSLYVDRTLAFKVKCTSNNKHIHN